MSQTFVIDGELVDLNKYVNACRGHWANGKRMKEEQDELVMAYIRKCRVKPMDTPIEVGISWVEPKRKGGKLRDIDNISFATKFIFDALVKCGVIPDDNPRHVRAVYHHFTFNSDEPRVEVVLMEYKPDGRTVKFAPVEGLE